MWRGSVGTALLAAVLVAGCSSEAERPSALPPVSTAPTPSASAVEPSLPAEAKAETPQAAAEFARFFYSEIGRAFNEKDPALIDRLSAPGCESCQLFIDSVASLRDENQRVTPVEFEVVVAEAPALTGAEATVDVIYNLDEVQRFDASGKLVFTEPAVEGREIQLALVRSGGSWLVREAEAV